MIKKQKPISAETLLDADVAVRTRGCRRSLRRLERIEPRLAGFVMEHSAAVYAALDRALDDRGLARSLHRRVMALVLVVCEAGLRRNRHG